MTEGWIVTILILGIVYIRYQKDILYILGQPVYVVTMGVVICLGFGVYFWVRHYLEKYQNKINMWRHGIRGIKEEKVIAYPFKAFDVGEQLKAFQKIRGWDRKTFLGLSAQDKTPSMVSMDDIQRTQHMQVLGMTGTGKSTSVFYPMIYQDALKGRPIIIIDAKGEMSAINTINAILDEVGRKEDFLLFSLSHKDLSCSYNPLYVGDHDPQVVIDAFFSNFDDDNSYYREMSKTMFTHTVKLLHSLGRPFSPMDVYCYLNHEACRLSINKQITKDNSIGFLNLKMLNQIISDLSDQYKGWRHVITGFNNFVMNFDDPLLNDEDSDIILTEAIRQKKIVYFQLPTNAYPIQAMSIARMVQSNLRYISSLIQTGRIESEELVSVFIDEYGSFAEKTFVEVLNKARSSRMMVTLAHQSFGDLENISRTFAKLIDENTLNKIYLKQTDPELAELIACSIGTYVKEEQTYRMTGGAWGNQIHSGETSNKTVNEFHFPPDKVKNLHKYGQGYFIYRGDNSQVCVNFGQFVNLPQRPYAKKAKHNKREGLRLFERYYLRQDTESKAEPSVDEEIKGAIVFDD
jgi:hypothetical protein